MKDFIKYEIIRNLKRKEIKLLFLILIMCELIFMTAMQKKSTTEGVYDDSSYWIATDAYFKANQNEYYEEISSKDIAKIENSLNLYNKYETDKNWNKMCYEAMKYLTYYAQVFMYSPNEKLDKDDAILLKDSNFVKELQSKYKFISIDEYAEIVDIRNNIHKSFPWALHELQYFTNLYEKELTPMTYSHIDSSTVFLQVLRNLLAIITPILIALLFFNDRKEYHEMGVDKSLMVIPKIRTKFVLSKIIANTIIMIIVIFGPILVFTIILGLFDHFKNLNYPLFANKKGLSQMYFPYFDQVYGSSTLQESIDAGTTTNFGITYTSGNMLFNPYMEFIPLWQGILPVVLLFILLIIFYVQINLFITRIIKNSYLALSVNIIIIILLIAISPLTSMEFLNVFNPLSYRDPGMNVMGTSYFPWLAGFMVLICYNFMIYVGNKIIFSHKYYD